MPARDTFCSYCGTRFEETAYPRTCRQCGQTTYRNPLPVAVVLVPVEGGLFTIRRGIEPHKGKLAFPGGYIELGESWQRACARELREETGIEIDASSISEFAVHSAPDGTLLVFGIATEVGMERVRGFVPTEEAPEIVIVRAPVEMAFSLHTEILHKWLEGTKP